jgi:two-component system, chemotaxis family, CheB/CheR fusion protein
MTPGKNKKVKTAKTPDSAEAIETQDLAKKAGEAKETAGKPSTGFPIVGIGASAGGLAAFEAFFSGMPADKNPDMAFVLVQHLAPDHKSILTDLVRRYTRMQVFEVEDGVVVQPNSVYIIPPNRDMAFLNGRLQLMEPFKPRGQRLPIDFFFRSLAQGQRERAICIVLSGTGSDGAQGVRAIKGEGGMAMAQNPESTEFDGMPRSAIDTGLVDFVLPPAEMPVNLIAYTNHAFGIVPRPAALHSKSENALKKIFILLRAQTGHDFSLYKQNTIKRRIERRMAVHSITDLGSYVSFFQKTPVEVEALFRDLLIGVTSFFRDTEAFAGLEAKVIPRLFANKPVGSPIRVWICGCSTGEEAYSIAILLLEQMDKLKRYYKLQLFATDIDSRAIDQARGGLYSASIATDVSPERLARFFTLEAEGSASYRINKSIRDMLVFSEQDVIKDPPFSKLDLISCRNVLIYMGSELQKKLIPLFHYALNPGGMLFLGTSETIGDYIQLFSTLDRQSRLYQRKEDLSGAQRLLPGRFLPHMTEEWTAQKPSGQLPGERKVSLRAITEQILLERYAPVSVLVSEQGEMLYVHGNTGPYLQMGSGEPDVNILKMAREGLKRDLTTALYTVVKHKKPVERPGLRVKTNGDFSAVNLMVLPLLPTGNPVTEITMYLVILEEARAPVSVDGVAPLEETAEKTIDADEIATALKQELRAKEEYLKSVNEELETSNEELKSSNEEMQSINEELQSTNEELETSKEELQSVNEELATVNTELQAKVFDLSRANNDMNNLLAGTGVGTVFVDFQLLIQRFTPSVTQVINLILSDVGRPVGHIVSNLKGYDTLVKDIRSVLDTLIPKEVEVQTKEGEWFLMRIRPYRTLENVIEGAVITFFDISEIKLAREELRKANDQLRLAVVVRDARDAVVLQDLEGRILAWNPAAERLYGWAETDALQMNIRELMPEGLRENELKRIPQLTRNIVLEQYRTQRIAKDGNVLDVWLTATALVNEDGQVYAIATTERARGIND